jgi:hypothetical protein
MANCEYCGKKLGWFIRLFEKTHPKCSFYLAEKKRIEKIEEKERETKEKERRYKKEMDLFTNYIDVDSDKNLISKEILQFFKEDPSSKERFKTFFYDYLKDLIHGGYVDQVMYYNILSIKMGIDVTIPEFLLVFIGINLLMTEFFNEDKDGNNIRNIREESINIKNKGLFYYEDNEYPFGVFEGISLMKVRNVEPLLYSMDDFGVLVITNNYLRFRGSKKEFKIKTNKLTYIESCVHEVVGEKLTFVKIFYEGRSQNGLNFHLAKGEDNYSEFLASILSNLRFKASCELTKNRKEIV